VHIITKSDLVIRDMDLFSQISRIYAAVSITITTPDDSISKRIEPGAPVSSDRFRAISELSKSGIYCGILFMPVLPWITDKPQHIQKLVYWAKEAGAKYIIASMGMTLREGQREFFYAHLDHSFPGLKTKYEQAYGRQYSANAPLADQLWNVYNTTCSLVQMPQRMNFYKPEIAKELRLF
jgi:DNA repair photolyase